MLIAGRSISSRLTVWFSSVFFLGFLLFGAVMWLDLKDTLMTGRSKTLTRRSERLSDLLRDIQGDPPGLRARKFQRRFAEAKLGRRAGSKVFRQDGSRELPSPSPAAQSFPWPMVTTADGEEFHEVDFSGQPYLVLIRPLVLGAESLVLYAASSLEGNRPILRTFSVGLPTRVVPALLALSALGGYLLSRRALKPVDQITAATRSISVSNLSERLPVPQTRDELQRLSETCNAMLARLESAVNEIKRFTADASHELRSPLSLMRTVAEVALKNQRADPESRRAFVEIVEECAKAGRLLEDLLTLARGDAGNAQLAFESVDLVGLVTGVCDKARLLPIAIQHTLTVSVDGARHAPVQGNYASLRRLIWILVENAAKYTPPPGNIDIKVKTTVEEISIAIADNGIGISAVDLPHIFERFYRADPSRSQVEGAGLGLSIAKWIAEIHDARLWVESGESVGSTFQVVFPVFAETLLEDPAFLTQGPLVATAKATRTDLRTDPSR